VAAGKALVLGGETGLLGQALVHELNTRGWEVTATGRPREQHFEFEGLHSLIKEASPGTIFNTWAYTQVDLAESEPQEARRVNAHLPSVLGSVVSTMDVKLVHFSTDFVFDGRQQSPYTESDTPKPMSVYGKTKLSGEAALLEQCPTDHLTIVRTAWLFGPGKKNFVSTILGLARERDRLTIVSDQHGSPTYTPDLASYTLDLVENATFGIFHVVSSGEASWFDLAHLAVKTAEIDCEVVPITSGEYPQKAQRPAYSVLSTEKFQRITGTEPRHWQKAVQEYVGGIIPTT